MAVQGSDVKLTIPAGTIQDILLSRAEKNPAGIAMEFQDRKIDYGKAAENSRRFAAALRELGIQPGDRVGIMLPNLPEFIVAYYGALMAGAIVVLYNVMLTPDEIEYICSDSGTKAMIVLDRFVPNLEKGTAKIDTFDHALVLGEKPEGSLGFDDLVAKGDPDFEPHGSKLDDIALLVYTSGTTGRPKGAMLSHSNVLHNMAQMDLMRPKTDQSKILCVLPLFHCFGLISQMNMCILRGDTLYLHPRFDAEAVVDALKNEGVTSFSGTPTMYFHILNHPSSEGATFPDLTRAGCGGAPLPVEIRQRFSERFGVDITEGYGLSESTVSQCGYAEGTLVKSGSIGMPNPGSDIRIVDDEGKEMPLGDVGEMIIRGPNIMQGYWNNPEETKKAIKDGWFYTGDLGYCDDQGYFFIVDRKKDMILKGGYNIYPRELEEVIYQLPQINMAAVIGVPDPAKGENVEAIVSLKPGQTITPEEIMDRLREHLSKYKLPKSVTIIPEIPVGPTNKILKRELRRRWDEIKQQYGSN